MTSQPSGAVAKPFVTHYNADDSERYLRIATEINLKKALISGVERVFEIGKIFRNEGVDWKHNPEFTSLEAYQSYANLDDMKSFFSDLIVFLTDKPVEIPTYDYDELVAKYGEDFDSHLQELCFVTGQPLSQTPLCKAREDGKADRFEVFANGFEIANAYNEIHTYAEQANRLDKDEDGILDALKFGMPPTGGIGIGVDRLAMYLYNAKNIKDVIFFT